MQGGFFLYFYTVVLFFYSQIEINFGLYCPVTSYMWVLYGNTNHMHYVTNSKWKLIESFSLGFCLALSTLTASPQVALLCDYVDAGLIKEFWLQW